MKFFAFILAATFLLGGPALSSESIQKAQFDNSKLKDQVLCMVLRSGNMNDAGEIQVDVMRRKIKADLKNEEDADEIMEKCAVKKATPQDTALELLRCLLKNKSKFKPDQ